MIDPRLTDTENEIMRSFFQGERWDAIAKQRNCSRQTIEQHMKNIYRKLEVNNLTQAIMEWLNGATKWIV